MAEERQQQTLMVGQDESVPGELSQIESIQNSLNDKNLKDVRSTDILQQALNETGDYSQPSTYNNSRNLQESIQHLSDHSYINSSNSNNITPSCDVSSEAPDSNHNSVQQEDSDSRDLQLSISLETPNVTDINTPQILVPSFSEDTNKMCLNGNVLSFNTINDNNSIDVFTNTPAVNAVSSESTVSCDSPIIEPPNTVPSTSQFIIRIKETTLPSSVLSSMQMPVKQTNAPVGSVQNPIQIVQNGNSYHSTQRLSEDQLKQIAHVLHKKQALKVLQNRSKSVMYDPSTKTRIVCRIVHPSDLQTKSDIIESNSKLPSRNLSNSFRGRGRPRKPMSKKSEEDEKGNSSLSKEEREEKKKHRPRTRSGRISKPPSYMVKDYKRIHHLDFNDEPHDDSDGGYSDFQVSDEEGEKGVKANNLPPGVTTAKQRNYPCNSCSKAYIGRGGLSRHYRLNPHHGSMPEGEDISTQDENSNSSLASSVLSNSGCTTNNQAASFVPVASKRAEIDVSPPTQLVPMATNNIVSNGRKARLREIMKHFSDEDVQEGIFSKFVQDVSLWDFFMAKCNKNPDELNIFEMLKEFETFIAHMQGASQTCLSPITSEVSQGTEVINISSQQIAAALSLEMGSYEVKTPTSKFSDSSPSSKILNCGRTLWNNNTSDILGVAENILSLKRKRSDSPVEVTTALPEQILSDTLPEGDSLELALSENLTTNAELQTQNMHTLSTSLCNTESHHDIVSKALFDLNSSTIVTSSSLSSGCLSAVNAPKSHPVSLLATRTPPKFQNIQVKKIQLIDTQQQILSSSDISVPVSNLPISAASTVNNLPHTQESIIVQKQVNVCDANGKMFQGLPLESNINMFHSSIQELPNETVLNNSSSRSTHTVPSVSLINTDIQNQNVPSFATQTVSVQTDHAETDANCLPEPHVASSIQNSNGIATSELQALVPSEVNMSTNASEEPREFQATHNVPEVVKLPESSAVLRHLMLPDGQVISVWSQVENETVQNEQFVQSYVPGNLIILQNPDGSFQVPSNQSIPAETLQSLAALNPGHLQ